MTAPLRPDWIEKTREDGRRDAEAARVRFGRFGHAASERVGLFLAQRRIYLCDNRWAVMIDNGTITEDDARILEAAWCDGAGLKAGGA